MKVHARLRFRLQKKIPMGGGLGGDLPASVGIALAERETGRNGFRPRDEQPHRLVAEQGLRLLVSVRIRDSERGDAKDDLPGDSQRLTTRGENIHIQCMTDQSLCYR